MFKLYLVRTVDRALYEDERVLMGVFDCHSSAGSGEPVLPLRV